MVASRFVIGGQPGLDSLVLEDQKSKPNYVGRHRRSFTLKAPFIWPAVSPALVRVEGPKVAGGYRLLPRDAIMVRNMANGPIPASPSGHFDAKGGARFGFSEAVTSISFQ